MGSSLAVLFGGGYVVGGFLLFFTSFNPGGGRGPIDAVLLTFLGVVLGLSGLGLLRGAPWAPFLAVSFWPLLGLSLLIVGWVRHVPIGVAGLATSLVGVAIASYYFFGPTRVARGLKLKRQRRRSERSTLR
jgi:hypothetical protein